ncbi:hypothetical protein KAU33_09210 [Candidatus Dependentiae bacterium]|nr:hypothetical protein [Candidatus Dependentiae bacterium]
MERDTKVETLFGREVLAHDNLRMVALTSASMIIQECKTWSTHKIIYFPPPSGTVLGDLNDTVNWSEDGFINALQSHVQIIYAYVEHIVDNPNNNYLDFTEAGLLTKALSMYQEWKEEKIKRDKEINGEIWGDMIGYSKAVWNDRNKELLAAYKN